VSLLRRAAVPAVLAILVVVAAIVVVTGRSDQKTLTAYFPRAVSVYEGSDVRVLGVPVGSVDTVTPEGTKVKVVMSYDPEVDVPASADAVIVSPAVVGDRYVQLTPAYQSGDTKMANGEVLDTDRTAVPIELDDIYRNVDDLTVALGPNGANSKGALSDLLTQTARNFGGQGQQFNTTIRNVARLTETLSGNKDELFGAQAELQRFVSTLADNDDVVRDFTESLGQVSTVLAGEREDLAAALQNLGSGLAAVNQFVRENRDVLGRDIQKATRVLDVFVRQRDKLSEVLKDAPVALNNLALTYNPQAGTLDVNSNVNENIERLLTDPASILCSIAANKPVCDLLKDVPGLPAGGGAGDGSGGLPGLPIGTQGLGGLQGLSLAQSDPTLGGLVGGGR